MKIKAIAYSYWRSIKRGTRTFANVPAGVQADVRTAAAAEVENGVITAEQYKQYIGADAPAV